MKELIDRITTWNNARYDQVFDEQLQINLLQEELDELLALEFESRLLSFEVESGNTIVFAFKNEIPLIKRKELLSKGKCLQEKMNIPMERYAKLLCDIQKL